MFLNVLFIQGKRDLTRTTVEKAYTVQH